MRIAPIRRAGVCSKSENIVAPDGLSAVGGARRHMVHAIAYLVAFTVFAGNTNAADSSRKTSGELKEIQSRIQSLSRELAKSEEKHSDASDQLRAAETSISVSTRHLRELADERLAVQAELNELQSQIDNLDKQSVNQQAQLAIILRSKFTHGDTDALQLLLAGRDPNQAARDEFFLMRLSQAKATMVRELQAIALEKRQIADKVAEHQTRISAIEKNERASREELLAVQKKRQATLAALASKISAQRREIGSLKRDEQRLTRLIEELGKIVAARPRPKPSVGADKTPSKPAKAVVQQKRIIDADPGTLTGAFGQLRGKLHLPVTGTIQGRFGVSREEGGTTWKGIFIRADEGVEVRAVAGGTVVFSEWMRGFGNLLVIDHDDDFFSVYGNNQTLLAGVGQQVSAGTTVSTVGASGGIAEPGLYFELRHKGQPFDPLKWMARTGK